VPDALPPDKVASLLRVVDRIYAEGVARDGLAPNRSWNLRNCIAEDAAFLELLDWPATFPLVVDLLSWNIHLITSHLIVRESSPPDTDLRWRAEGWHRDGGTSSTEMQEPHPRLFIKVAYWLTDLSEPGRGSIRFVPGSNRLIGRPAQGDGMADPYGAIEICARPGDAVLFEQRTWHAVGANTSDLTRKSLFFGYGYRWLHPMDYKVQSPELLAQCNPIQRQLLGDVKTPLGSYIPQDEDVPLRAWQQSRQTATP
jgi:ectoine hydroxylase-related dioxygenase (phytanoyl-CoA dioxygenase family)